MEIFCPAELLAQYLSFAWKRLCMTRDDETTVNSPLPIKNSTHQLVPDVTARRNREVGLFALAVHSKVNY